MRKKLTVEEFISRSRKVHCDKYGYYLIDGENKELTSRTKVKIVCKIHGEFQQRYDHHLTGSGCSECGGNLKSDRENFILKANKVHGDRYNYDLIEYVNAKTKVKIVCKIHGEFWQTPNKHLCNRKCPKCAILERANQCRLNKEDFTLKARQAHGDKYDYSLVEYISAIAKVKIVCKIHGEFWQTPNTHLCGGGCSKCADISRAINQSSNTQEFILKARQVHGDKYDYNLVEYVNNRVKVKIVCKVHGEFVQAPATHFCGSGCPKCICSRGEIAIEKCLRKYNIQYVPQKKFEECRNIRCLPFDFEIIINNKSCLIEFQGMQHYEQINYTCDVVKHKKEFEKLVKCDNIKKKYCKCNNIPLLVIPYWEINNIEKIINMFVKKEKS